MRRALEVRGSISGGSRRGRRRLIAIGFSGGAAALAMLTAAWACSVHAGKGTFTLAPDRGQIGTIVTVTNNIMDTSYNRVKNVYMSGPVATQPLLTVVPQACKEDGPGQTLTWNAVPIGKITYTRGVGVGTGTIPTHLNSVAVQSGSFYEICASPNITYGSDYNGWGEFLVL